MTEQEQEQLKAQLLSLRETLRESAGRARDDALPVELDQCRVGRLSRMDAMQARAMAAELERRHQLTLKRVDIALKKMEKGDYGYCALCDEEIDIRRLRFDPTNPWCLACAAKSAE